jgi:hypothetical protein
MVWEVLKLGGQRWELEVLKLANALSRCLRQSGQIHCSSSSSKTCERARVLAILELIGSRGVTYPRVGA